MPVDPYGLQGPSQPANEGFILEFVGSNQNRVRWIQGKQNIQVRRVVAQVQSGNIGKFPFPPRGKGEETSDSIHALKSKPLGFVLSAQNTHHRNGQGKQRQTD
jgi:hypothetical protein